MNDQMTQVVNFLFVPEATLSVVFLAIFVILLMFGLFIYVKCLHQINALRDNAAEEYESVSRRINPEDFLRRRLDRFSALEGILEGIPDFFVSIGILATFIGLGVAIQEASGLLSAEKFEMEKMVGLLGIIAFKFQTSVWGITFSLLFRRFIVERYFDYRQHVLDDVREILYSKERDSIQTLLEKQNNILQEELEYRKIADESLMTRLLEIKTQQKENFITQTEMVEMKFAKLETLHEKHMTKLDSLHEHQLIVMDKFHNIHIAKLQDVYDNLISKLATMHDERLTKMMECQTNLLAALSESRDIIAEQLATTVSIQNDLDRYVKAGEYFAETAHEFANHTSTFDGQVRGFRQEVVMLHSNMTETLEKISNQQKYILDEFGNVRCDILREMNNYLEEIQKIFRREENQYVQATRDKFESVVQRSEETFKNILNDSIKGVQEKYIEEVNRFANVTGNLSKVLKEIDARVEKMHTETLTGQKKFGEGLDNRVAKLHSEILMEQKKIGEAMEKSAAALHEEMIAEQKMIGKRQYTEYESITKIINGIGKAAKIYQDNLHTLHDRMQETMDGMEKLQKGLNTTVMSQAATTEKSLFKIEEMSDALIRQNAETQTDTRETFADALEKLVSKQNDLRESLGIAMSVMMDNIRQTTMESSERQIEQWQRLEQSAEEFKAEMVRVGQELSTQVVEGRKAVSPAIDSAMERMTTDLPLQEMIDQLRQIAAGQELLLAELRQFNMQHHLISSQSDESAGGES